MKVGFPEAVADLVVPVGGRTDPACDGAPGVKRLVEEPTEGAPRTLDLKPLSGPDPGGRDDTRGSEVPWPRTVVSRYVTGGGIVCRRNAKDQLSGVVGRATL